MSKKIDGKELMIARNGKPTFAVRIENAAADRNVNYVYVENGDVKFASSWLDSIQPFEVGNVSHKLAKEIFTIALQSAIQVKVLELRQLESIFHDIGLADCLGDVIVDAARQLESRIVAVEEKIPALVAHEVEEVVLPIARKKKPADKTPAVLEGSKE